MCDFPLCSLENIKGSNYCIFHNRYYGEPKQKKESKPLPKKSPKRKVEEKEYKKIVDEMLAESNLCDMKVPNVCTKIATGLHHQKKRAGKLYLDRRYLIRSCNECNLWAELYPLQAIELGLSISKFKPEGNLESKVEAVNAIAKDKKYPSHNTEVYTVWENHYDDDDLLLPF